MTEATPPRLDPYGRPIRGRTWGKEGQRGTSTVTVALPDGTRRRVDRCALGGKPRRQEILDRLALPDLGAEVRDMSNHGPKG